MSKESIGRALRALAQWSIVVPVLYAWRAFVWLLGASWAVTKWAGRVALWVVFWPAGLWRSIAHGRDRRDRRQAQLLADELERRRQS